VGTSQEVNVVGPIETALVGYVVTAVDAEIAKISTEEHPRSGVFASAGGSDDADEGREEV
jgi:hypothetical protein